jgi:predicted MFS family arabinose efflux permease
MSNRTLIIALAFIAFFGVLTQLAITPMLGGIAEDFEVSVSLVGQAVTVSFIAAATLGLVAGPMGDHYGHRPGLAYRCPWTVEPWRPAIRTTQPAG